VEKKTETSYAVHITLTDKDLVDKPVPPGQWRHITSGMSTNLGFVTTASLYSQEKDDPGHAHALSAWLAMTGSTQTMHEMSFPAPGDGEPLVFSGPGMHKMEIIHGPPPAGMEFKEGAPPATSVKGQRADGLSFTLETKAVSEAAPTSRWCLAPYMVSVLGSWAAQPGVIVQKKSIKVEDRGALARFSFTVVGQAKKDTRTLDNVAYLLGRPQHCTMVHFMADGGTPSGATQLEQVEKTVSVGQL
jgi:hypothetical protein